MKKNEPIIQATSNGKNFYLLFTITEFDGIPILFIVTDDYNNLYLCDCVEFREKQIWLISPIKFTVLMQLMNQQITILSAFKNGDSSKIIATFDYDTGKFTQEIINFDEISPENLPEEGAFVYSKSDDPMLYWSEVTNSAKIAVRDGDNLPQILTMLENAVGTVKAAMA